MANINILVGQKVKLSIVPTVAKLEADLVGIPTWVAADPSKVGIAPAEDGLTCVVTGRAAGSSAVTATALGATSLNANHTIVVAASNLADAIALTAEILT